MGNSIVLVIIDMQTGAFDGKAIPPVADAENLLANVVELTIKAREANIPIIFVQHNGEEGHPFEHGSAGWYIHPDINQTNQDIIIQKTTPDSFYKTDLQSELDQLGIKKIIVAGLQTEYCIDTTCRRAFSLGYDVILAGDAHGTWDRENLTAPQIISHHNTILREWFSEVKEVLKIDFNQ
jgi:nicotinamidase-related amidase